MRNNVTMSDKLQTRNNVTMSTKAVHGRERVPGTREELSQLDEKIDNPTENG